jgi:hypothetical protein
MNETQFKKVEKVLRDNHITYYNFELDKKTGRVYRTDTSGGSDADFLELGVDTLFKIINGLLK